MKALSAGTAARYILETETCQVAGDLLEECSLGPGLHPARTTPGTEQLKIAALCSCNATANLGL